MDMYFLEELTSLKDIDYWLRHYEDWKDELFYSDWYKKLLKLREKFVVKQISLF